MRNGQFNNEHRAHSPAARRLLGALCLVLTLSAILFSGVGCMTPRSCMVVYDRPSPGDRGADSVEAMRADSIRARLQFTAEQSPLAGTSILATLCNPMGVESLALATGRIKLYWPNGQYACGLLFGSPGPLKGAQERCVQWGFGTRRTTGWCRGADDDFFVHEPTSPRHGQASGWFVRMDLPVVSTSSGDTVILNYFVFPKGIAPIPTAFEAQAGLLPGDERERGTWPYSGCTDIGFTFAPSEPIESSAVPGDSLVYRLTVRASSRCPDSVSVAVDEAKVRFGDATEMPVWLTNSGEDSTARTGQVVLGAETEWIRLRFFVRVENVDGSKPLDGHFWLSQELMFLPARVRRQLEVQGVSVH